MKILLPIILIGLLLVSPLHAQHELMPTHGETVQFLKKHIPSAMQLLDRVQLKEGKAAYKNLLNDAKFDLMDYREVLEYDGKERADLFLKELQLDYQIKDVAMQHIKAKGNAEKQKELHAKLSKLAETQKKIMVDSLTLEMEDMKHVVKSLEAEIEETANTTTEQRVSQILLNYAPEVTKYPPKLPDGWLLDLPQALAKGNAEKKDVVVVFSTGWCPPCQKMLREVFPAPAVIKALENYIPVYVDGDKFAALRKDHNVRFYPTMIIVNHSRGSIVKRTVGAAPAAGFAEWLKPAKPTSPETITTNAP